MDFTRTDKYLSNCEYITHIGDNVLPSWIGKPYCMLYSDYKEESFTLNEARRKIEKSKELTRKILSELNARGLLIARKGNYYLPNFDSFCLGIKLNREYKELDLEEKLKRASEIGKDYLVVGGYAAFLYHSYQFPVDHKIRVNQEDYGFWFNYLDEAIIEPTLTEEQVKAGNEVGKLKVLDPQHLVTELLEDGSTGAILDAVSIIVSQKIKWDELSQIAKDHELEKKLGAVLDALERELGREGKRLVPKSITDELSANIKKAGRFEKYPKETLIKDNTFSKIGKKWRLKFFLPQETVRKPVEDLVAQKK